MRPLNAYIATSKDGFIARPDGDTSWLHGPDVEIEGEDFGYAEFYDRIDTTLMGRETYGAILRMGVPFPYPDKTNYVYSRLARYEEPHIQWVRRDLVNHVRNLKTQAGKGIWLIGGAEIFQQIYVTGLIDELIITQVPVELGEGIALWNENSPGVPYETVAEKTYPNGVRQSHSRKVVPV